MILGKGSDALSQKRKPQNGGGGMKLSQESWGVDYFHSAQIKGNLGKKSKEEPPQTNDVILDIIGHDGLWQRWIFLWMLLAAMTVSWHYMPMSFYAPNLDYWCSRPDDSNRTVDEWKNVALPEDKRCSRFKNQSTLYLMDDNSTNLSAGEVVSCDSWEYDTSFYSSTVLSQFDLVCEREWLVSLSTSLFNVGGIISNVIVAHLSDSEPFRYLAERFNSCQGYLCDNPLPLPTARFPKPFRQAFFAIRE
ncbi:hypothetical protein AVEN_104819-1 [Araneus ventricosus]|uniref:Uncharacterized protein n=1 Tax=Araneus ventricosus TaxID=182803 RepID=A0A4Y2IAA3_ARAVE|nr:hypothetical protein AVEN_104819-1 [Araneus ventricosus]